MRDGLTRVVALSHTQLVAYIAQFGVAVFDGFDQIAAVVNARRDEVEADLVQAERLLAEARRNLERAEADVEAAQRTVVKFQTLLDIADGDTPNSEEQASLQWLTLHDAMKQVLEESQEDCLTAHEIAVRIEERRLYRMRDGRSVEPQQIHARVGHYPALFKRTGNGRIALAKVAA